jgi:hypothetical protein
VDYPKDNSPTINLYNLQIKPAPMITYTKSNINSIIRWQVIGLILLFALRSSAQQTVLTQLKQQYDSLLTTAPLEIVHIHTDRNHYLVGDTLWYKSYLIDSEWGGFSEMSGIIYVDLVNEEGEVVIKNRQHLKSSTAAGFIPLIKDRKVKPGRYYLRGYTQYLLNFGSDFLFKKIIEIDGGTPIPFQINLDEFELKEEGDSYASSFPFLINYINTNRPSSEPLHVSFLHKGNEFDKQTLLRDSGLLHLRFPKHFDQKELKMQIVQGQTKIDVPLPYFQKEKELDIQILPEGGAFIDGITSSFGIKILDIFGKGVSFRGIVRDEHQNIVHQFASVFGGMSRINLPSAPLPSHIIELTFENGLKKTISFPKSIKEGVSIQVDPSSIRSTQFRLNIECSSTFYNQNLAIAAIFKGKMVYGAQLSSLQTNHRIAIEKTNMPHGILDFMVIAQDGQILTSRKVYNELNKPLMDLSITSNQASFKTQSPIEVLFKVNSKEVLGANQLSVTVVDEYQVSDPSFESSILSTYFLQSEIKGHVEKPGFYFSDDERVPDALDNLMLTQGWISYSPERMKQLTEHKLPIEKEYGIFGMALNVFNNSLSNTRLTIKGHGNSSVHLETTTDEEGRFYISDQIPAFDSAYFVVEAFNRRNRSFNVGLVVHEEPLLNVSEEKFEQPTLPWYLQRNPQRQNLLIEQDKVSLQNQTGDTTRILQHIVLDDVEILNSKFVPRSSNPNGPGQANLVFNQEDFKHEKHATLFDFLEFRIKDLEVGYFNNNLTYRIDGKPAVFILNGILLNPEINNTSESYYGYYYRLFSSIGLEQVDGVEISYRPNYIVKYQGLHHSSMRGVNPNLNPYFAYIEITFKPGFKPLETINEYNENIKYVRPHPFHYNKQFYSPKYPTEESKMVIDRRATLFWEPNLSLDKQGSGAIRFYSARQAGQYTVHIEGMDEEGNFIVGKHRIKIVGTK